MTTIALRTNAITAKVCEEMHLECTDYFQSKVNIGTNYCLTIVYRIFNVSYIFSKTKIMPRAQGTRDAGDDNSLRRNHPCWRGLFWQDNFVSGLL